MKRLITAAVLAACSINAASAGEVMSYEDRKSQMDAQIDLLKKEAELNDARRTAAGSNARGLPTVLSVSIVGDKRKVRLQMPNGGTDHFSVGEEIQNNVFLASVDLRKVVVIARQGKKNVPITLDFATTAAGALGGNMAPAPMRAQDAVPASLLPPPPVVPIPTMGRIQGAGATTPAPAAAASPAAVIPPAMNK